MGEIRFKEVRQVAQGWCSKSFHCFVTCFKIEAGEVPVIIQRERVN